MKREALVIVTIVIVLANFSGGHTTATQGGVPEVHDMNGREFGEAVSELAQEDPLGLADHVSGGHVPSME
jgi:hypothetical protein